MATLYFIRHQAAGILHEQFFVDPPQQAQIDAIVAQCESRHGKEHPKSGQPYWAKVIKIDTDKPLDDPGRVVTHCGCSGESASQADAKAAGYCPIREGHHVPEKDLAGGGGISDHVSFHGVGTVKNP